MSINKVILIGWLGHDPELRHTEEGTPVCNINLATSEIWKNKNGEEQKRTEWHRIVFWRHLAEIVAKYLRTGSKIYVEGKIQSREYESPANSGNKKKAYEIIAHEMRILDGRKSTSSSSGEATV